jgi:hypothetical protein
VDQPGRERRISSSSGKRPSLCLEKISLPSTITSNWPGVPVIRVEWTPISRSMAAARLAARGL